MRSTTTRRRLLAGGGIALALFGGLMIAERGSEAPTPSVSSKSIATQHAAFSRPQINIPSLLQKSPLATQARPSLAALPSGPSTQQLGGGLPGGDNICDALFAEREALLELDGPAVEAQLALNSFWLAVFHCQEISGDFDDD